MDKKTTGIIAYLTIVGWLIAYLTGDKEGAKFHLNQSLVLAIAEIVLSIISGVLSHIPFGGLISWACSIALFVFWILGFVSAIKDEEKPVPVIGTIQILK
ncbi:MAG: hypothetical protein MJ123_04350 [Lachnospiraceae bacterium]|nr:hypothetical protein [Lachnospiraceae bacterium]